MPEARRTPLHYVLGQTSGLSPCGVLVSELASTAFLVLHGDARDELFQMGVKQVLGIDVPAQPCTFAAFRETVIYWLGPGEWLIVVSASAAEPLEVELREVLRGSCALTDVSGGLALINLSGDGVQEILQKSCTYDFHPRHFPAGRCVQTNFAKATALVSKAANGSFNLVIRRSFADYVAQWILDAGLESGCRIESVEHLVS